MVDPVFQPILSAFDETGYTREWLTKCVQIHPTATRPPWLIKFNDGSVPDSASQRAIHDAALVEWLSGTGCDLTAFSLASGYLMDRVNALTADRERRRKQKAADRTNQPVKEAGMKAREIAREITDNDTDRELRRPDVLRVVSEELRNLGFRVPADSTLWRYITKEGPRAVPDYVSKPGRPKRS